MKVQLSTLLIALLVTDVFGHEGLKEEEQRLTERIESGIASAQLYLDRGRIHHQSGDWMSALRDYRHAEKIEASLLGLDLAYAAVFSQLHNWTVASEYVESHLKRNPRDVAARELLAEILVAQGKFDAGVDEYDRIVSETSKPSPEVFLERARACIRSKRPAEALTGLDEGIERLGPVPGLQLLAIEFCREQQAFDAAIERVNQLLVNARRKEHWLVMRGEIQFEAKRPTAALESLTLAREAFNALRPSQRTTSSSAELLSRLDSLILEANSSTTLHLDNPR